jgi:hypothetical protein
MPPKEQGYFQMSGDQNNSANSRELVLVCLHVLKQERPVHVLIHHSDGKRQITCGEDDHFTEDDVEVVHVGHLWDRYPELRKIWDETPKGYLSECNDVGHWKQSIHDD